jgi:enoyl-CoA hydratase
MADYQTIELDHRPPVAIVKLNRPDKRNALSIQLRDEMTECLKGFEGDDDIKAVLITGNGPAFSAGFDLEEFKNPDPAHVQAIRDSSKRFHAAVSGFCKPIVAAVNGYAMAGGFDLAVMCDIRLASEKALFGHPEIRFGSPVLYGLLKEVVGGGMARDLCLSGRSIDAQEAYRIGLVSRVVPPEKLMEESLAFLEELCKSPLSALVTVKRSVLESAREAIEEAASDEGQSFADIIREGMKK